MTAPAHVSPAGEPDAGFRGSRRPNWAIALASLVVAIVAVLVIYRETATAMVGVWYRSETFNHSFFVPPISLWLIWRRRFDLAVLAPAVSPAGIAATVFGGLVWLLGDLAAVNSVTQFALIGMIVATVPALLGLHVARRVLFPLAFLFFAVPVGEFLMPWFMEMTADFTVSALRLTGIPVFREGLQFVIPSGSWSVVEACSGIRYLIASVTVGTLYAYLNYQSVGRRGAFIGLSILVPIVANWLRAYMIVMIGHLSGNKLAVGVDHLVYGWVFFGVVILVMFTVGARWFEPESRADGMSMDQATLQGCPEASQLVRWLTVAGLVAIVASPEWIKFRLEGSLSDVPVVLSTPVMHAQTGWIGVEATTSGFVPGYEAPSGKIHAAYAKAGSVVTLYVGYYRAQTYDRKLVGYGNGLVGAADKVWVKTRGGDSEVKIGDEKVQIRTAELVPLPDLHGGSTSRLVAWQVYWIDGTLTANDYLAKAYSAVYQLLGRGDDSAVIVVYTRKDAPGGADFALFNFLAEGYPAIDSALRAARSGR